MKNAKPVYCDWAARLRTEVPPIVPSPGRSLYGDQARMCGLWMRRWHQRKPYVPISPRKRMRIQSWISGTRQCRVEEFEALYRYISRKKDLARQKRQATLTINFGVGGPTLGRPFLGADEAPSGIRLLRPKPRR